MSVRNQAVLGLLAVAGLGLALTSPAGAGDKKPAKQGTNLESKPGKAPMTARAMQDLGLAEQLIRYGRQEKNAESLLLAAQILQKTQTQPLKVDHTVAMGKAGKTGKAPKQDNTPKGLLAEAKKMSSSAQVMAMAKVTDKLIEEFTRGAVGGPRTDGFTIGAYQTITWNPIAFRAGERAEVFISTRGFSRMILEITDENGNLVARDNIPGNYYRCVWTPRWTGSFRIRLVSNDNIAFNCGMATN